LCFDISNLEKQTILIDNFSTPKLENKRERVTLKGIKNTFNIWQPRNGMKMWTIMFTIFGFQQLFCSNILGLDLY
jgi:hypothetical protein